MMNWDVSDLKEGFSRSIVGYDLREKSIELLCTIEDQVWPGLAAKSVLTSQINGFNLFDQIDDEIEKYKNENPVFLTAFDMPSDLAKTLSSTFGLLLLPLESLSETRKWKFLGFDVSDMRTQSSAFYSFDWTEIERQDLTKKLSMKFNKYGLIESDSEAIKISSAFDTMIPEHHPFVPCGVWVRDK